MIRAFGGDVLATAALSLSSRVTTPFNERAYDMAALRTLARRGQGEDGMKPFIRRHRTIAAGQEKAAKCLESGKAKGACNAALAPACQGIAYVSTAA